MDRTDIRLLLELVDDPRATIMALAQRLGLSRNTVQARLARFDQRDVLTSFERRVNPAAIGYPLTASIAVTVVQQRLDDVAASLSEVPEVLEILGMSGAVDMLVRVAARDAEDLYRIAGRILATDGVDRTETALVMRNMLDYRTAPLLHHMLDAF
jgi:DNA-binding Lrp family transcriptional regulator